MKAGPAAIAATLGGTWICDVGLSSGWSVGWSVGLFVGGGSVPTAQILPPGEVARLPGRRGPARLLSGR